LAAATYLLARQAKNEASAVREQRRTHDDCLPLRNGGTGAALIRAVEVADAPNSGRLTFLTGNTQQMMVLPDYLATLSTAEVPQRRRRRRESDKPLVLLEPETYKMFSANLRRPITPRAGETGEADPEEE